jgi:hypothetical protein
VRRNTESLTWAAVLGMGTGLVWGCHPPRIAATPTVIVSPAPVALLPVVLTLDKLEADRRVHLQPREITDERIKFCLDPPPAELAEAVEVISPAPPRGHLIVVTIDALTGQAMKRRAKVAVGTIARPWPPPDSTGVFHLTGVPSGVQVLETRVLGYWDRRDSIRMPAAHGLRLRITLTERPACIDLFWETQRFLKEGRSTA